MDENKRINKIAGYRVMLGFTQSEMGKIIGVSKQAYSSKERGKTKFNDIEKLAIKNFFGLFFSDISIEELFF